MNKEDLETVNYVSQIIYDKKGVNIVALDVSEFSSITDAIIVAEGSVDRHVVAIGKTIVEELKKKGHIPVHAEGLDHGDWVVLDYLNFIVHILMPDMRELYELEKLWSDGKLIDVEIAV